MVSQKHSHKHTLVQDARSAKHRFVHCYTFSQVRILVTHGLGFLPQCDRIVVMDDGKITEVGTYPELMDNKGAFAELIRHFNTVEENEEDDPCK